MRARPRPPRARARGLPRGPLGPTRGPAQLLERAPEGPLAGEAALHCGIERLLAGDAAGARAALESRAVGEGAAALYWRARASAALGDHAGALAALDRAARAQPDQALAGEIEAARGDALAALGRGDEASRAWQKAGSEYALQAAAVAALNAGRAEEAERAARALLERHPGSRYRAEAELVLAEALFARGRHAEAEPLFAGLAPQGEPAARARCRSRAAWCAWLAGDAAGAAEAFAALAREMPDAREAQEARLLEGRAR